MASRNVRRKVVTRAVSQAPTSSSKASAPAWKESHRADEQKSSDMSVT